MIRRKFQYARSNSGCVTIALCDRYDLCLFAQLGMGTKKGARFDPFHYAFLIWVLLVALFVLWDVLNRREP